MVGRLIPIHVILTKDASLAIKELVTDANFECDEEGLVSRVLSVLFFPFLMH